MRLSFRPAGAPLLLAPAQGHTVCVAFVLFSPTQKKQQQFDLLDYNFARSKLCLI